MKKFIVDIIVGTCCFCFIWIVGELVFDKYKGQNVYSYKYNYTKNNPRIKTLLIGTSHFENGLNPYILGDSVFDSALGGRGCWIGWEVALAEQLIPTLPNLRTVIYPLGYNQPFESVDYTEWTGDNKEIVEEYMYFYTKYMDIPYDHFPQKLNYYSALWFNKMGLKYWMDEEVDSLGYNPCEGQMSDWQNVHNVRDSVLYYDEAAEKSYTDFIEGFRKIAKICYDNDVRFIVVTCPCSNAYVVNTQEDVIKRMEATVDSVKMFYPIEYKNYLSDDEFRADSLYYNSSHLNATGADIFTLRLKKDFGL